MKQYVSPAEVGEGDLVEFWAGPEGWETARVRHAVRGENDVVGGVTLVLEAGERLFYRNGNRRHGYPWRVLEHQP